MESSLKIGHYKTTYEAVAISYKVFISVPTRIKQNHPRGTLKKTDLKKQPPMATCQKEKEKKEKEKTPGLPRILGWTHASHNKHHTKRPGKLNAIGFILGKSWTPYI